MEAPGARLSTSMAVTSLPFSLNVLELIIILAVLPTGSASKDIFHQPSENTCMASKLINDPEIIQILSLWQCMAIFFF